MTDVLEYEVYLPTSDPARLEPYHRELVERFGGLTDTRVRHEGVWRHGGVEMKDEIVTRF